MYLYATFEGEKAKTFAQQRPPFGINITDAVTLSRIAKIEHWASSFTDAGNDFNEFRLFDAEGRLINTIRKKGY